MHRLIISMVVHGSGLMGVTEGIWVWYRAGKIHCLSKPGGFVLPRIQLDPWERAYLRTINATAYTRIIHRFAIVLLAYESLAGIEAAGPTFSLASDWDWWVLSPLLLFYHSFAGKRELYGNLGRFLVQTLGWLMRDWSRTCTVYYSFLIVRLEFLSFFLPFVSQYT